MRQHNGRLKSIDQQDENPGNQHHLQLKYARRYFSVFTSDNLVRTLRELENKTQLQVEFDLCIFDGIDNRLYFVLDI